MTQSSEPAQAFLDSAYQSLGYSNGTLLNAVDHSTDDATASAQWTEVGDWLALASRMGADKVFFVGSDPVLLFRELDGPIDASAIREAYRQA